MSRQKKFDALMDDEDIGDGNVPYDEDEQPYEDEEGGEVITKEKIEEHYKKIRGVVAGDVTKKEIMGSLEKNKYDVKATIAELQKLIAERELKKKETKKEVKKEAKEDKKETSKKPIVVEEEKTKHKAAAHAESPVKDLNIIYPSIEYKCLKGAEEDKGNNISLVVIGHVDSGKSTLMGHLMYMLGYVPHAKMHQYEKESKNIGKASFQFAWVLDETEAEREKGVTINIAVKHFQLKDKSVTLIDAPGHRDFIPNMISGAAQADAAILVIDSKKGAFEAGFFHSGQTKEHAILARCLGVTQIIVAINKLDMNDWSEGTYTNIKSNVDPFLALVGYKPENIRYVPISGLKGENLIECSKIPELVSWYKGPCLADTINLLKPNKKANDKPARGCISDCYTNTFDVMKGTCLSLKMEGGVIEVGDKLMLMPLKAECTVKGITVKEEKKSFTQAGDNAEVAVAVTEELDISHVKGGMVLSSIEHCIHSITTFRAQVITFELQSPITLGYQVTLHCYSLKVPAKITKIEKAISGKTTKLNPKLLMSNTNAFIVITTLEKVCLELYQNYKGLGRIALRDTVGTLATGMIIELLK